MLEAVFASLVGAALWHLAVLAFSRYREAKIRSALQAHTVSRPQEDSTIYDPSDSQEVQQGHVRLSLGSYGSIHRSPYLYIRNAGDRPLDVLGVVFTIERYGDFSAPYETPEKEGAGLLRLLPGAWGKWVYCCGRNIPEEYDELTACTVIIRYKALLGIRRVLRLPIQGDLFDNLKHQLKHNKRG